MTSLPDRFIAKYGRLPTEFDPDYLEMLRMTKYVVTDVPNAAPGKCSNCGASKNDGRKYVDFGLYVEWYGTVHLCGHCLTDISDSMGIFDSLKAQLVESEEARDSVVGLKEKGEELHETVVKTFKELEEFYVGLYPHVVGSNSDSSSSVGTSPPAPESRVTKAEPRTTKSNSGGGSTNIRSLADLLEN